MLLNKADTLLMIGDSITDVDRQRPVGEGLGTALGNGYPMLVDALLTSVYPEMGVRCINMGISGNTVRDLKERWQSDVFDLKPDWLSILIGVNDVWRQYDQPRNPALHVPLDEYDRTLDDLVARTLPAVKGIVLMMPYYMEPLTGDAMRNTMDEYGGAVKKIAQKYGTLLVDTQRLFDDLLAHMHSANIAWDRVHPNNAGHMTIARGLLKALEFDWSRA